MNPTPLRSDILKSKRWKWHIPSEKTVETIRSLVLSAPHLVKSTPVRAVYHCGDYFLKFERSPDLWSAFRKSMYPKARMEYEIGQNLAAAGIPAVECLGWGKLGGTNVLITRAIPGTVTMDKFFYEQIVCGGGNADGVLAEITAFLKKFFDAGFYHGDLHFGNILYHPRTHELTWVDLIAIGHPGRIEPAAIRLMCRCIVTLREGLAPARIFHVLRDLGAAETDAEAETYYFAEIRRSARHLIETWEKRSRQVLGGYPKFAELLPCPAAPGRTLLLRKDWLERTIIPKEDAARGLPPGYELLRAKDEAEAERIYLRSYYLHMLRIRHRRVAAFLRPNELWLEPLPAGLPSAPPALDDADAAFFRRTLDEAMIEAPAESIRRLPDGTFYVTDLTRLYTGFEA